jgi:hypothetical protein
MLMSVDVGLAWKAADVVMLLVVTVAALRLQRFSEGMVDDEKRGFKVLIEP